jgi:hypothetical protein
MLTLTITGTTDTQDTDIDVTNATTNYGTQTALSAGESIVPFDGVRKRILIKFSLAAIPAGSVINSAVLSLYIDSDLASNARDINVYRLLRAWTEAGATWNKYDGTNDWGTAGAGNTSNDREAANIGSTNIASDPATDFEVQITLTASKIQEMLNNGIFTNNGFLLQMSTEDNDYHSFRSSEYAVDTTKIPKLVISYTPPEGGVYLISE